MILSWQAPIYYNDKLTGSYDAEGGSYETAGSNFDYLSLLTGEPYPADMDKPKIFFPCKRKTADLRLLMVIRRHSFGEPAVSGFPRTERRSLY